LFVKYKKIPRKTYTDLVLWYYYRRDLDTADEDGEEGESIPLSVTLLPLGVLAFIAIGLYSKRLQREKSGRHKKCEDGRNYLLPA
jgi:hypothetical protein